MVFVVAEICGGSPPLMELSALFLIKFSLKILTSTLALFPKGPVTFLKIYLQEVVMTPTIPILTPFLIIIKSGFFDRKMHLLNY